jgi:amino acid permease
VHHLGYASVLAAATYIALLILIDVHGIQNRIGHDTHTVDVPIGFAPSHGSGGNFLLSFGIIKFCYAGHEVFFTIEQQLKPISRYNRVMIVAFAGMILINLCMSVTGYATFGTQASSNILLNLSNNGFGYAARLLVGLMLIVTVPIVLLAAFEMIEDVLWMYVYLRHFDSGRMLLHVHVHQHQSPPVMTSAPNGDATPIVSNSTSVPGLIPAVVDRSDEDSAGSALMYSDHSVNDASTAVHQRKLLPLASTSDSGTPVANDASLVVRSTSDLPPKDFSLWTRMVIRTPLTLLSVAIAIFIPSFASVVGLVGAVGDSTIGLLLPVIFYMSIHRQLNQLHLTNTAADVDNHVPTRPSIWMTVMNVFVLLLGTLGLASGVAILLWT